MTAIEQADHLQQQAITLLLAERQQIDDRLSQLGHSSTTGVISKKRGRKPKQQAATSQVSLESSPHSQPYSTP